MGIKSACSAAYRAAHDSGPRYASAIKYIVIHSTEGDTAAGAASWFANPRSAGSANLVVDDQECFRTVPDTRIPWAAPPLNSNGFHIELAGYARWTRAQWLAHLPTIERAAYKTADRAVRYGVPLRRVGWVGLRLRRRGITDHRSVSKAFRQSTHTDPGANFPWDVFMARVQTYAKEKP